MKKLIFFLFFIPVVLFAQHGVDATFNNVNSGLVYMDEITTPTAIDSR